ncbi:MAG: SDR family NAD(P)-dependent oxidoreductase [Limisphaerales bacterium]
MPAAALRHPALASAAAFITGGGSGIGRATARALAHEGAGVIVADISGPAAADVAAELRAAGHAVQTRTMDVADEAAWDAAFRTWPEGWPPLRVLVNCAGVSSAAPVAETAFADWRRLHAVNLDGAFLGTRAGLRAMRGTGGVIVNVASRSGVDVFPGAAAYSASKAAVIQFSRVADAECAAAGGRLRVLHLAPGGVKTPLWRTMPGWAGLARGGEDAAWRALDPAGEFLTAEEVAGQIVELVRGHLAR